MRAGICSIQQALTAEALIVVKQAVNLARRRGHAQVTPLHVASVMLATSGGLLRKACLQSHSHPLQCKALELCFNVALNRLPASTSSALLGPPHSSFPSLSNALVAAFKRAQAHQRRGSIENQQQPILALKIEIEQLVISILDDPSVSRVMREAGFSSTQVKSKVEQAVSLEICSQSNNNNNNSTPVSSQPNKEMITSVKPEVIGSTMFQFSPFSQFGITLGKPLEPAREEDVMSVLNTLVTKRRNIVIIGECLATAESVLRGAMDKIERGLAPGELRSARIISLPLLSLRSLSKEEVDQKLVEVRCIVKSYMNRGVVLYLGDLKWVAEFWSSYCDQRRNYYSSVEYIILELQRLVRGSSETGRLWLIGTATFKAYMKCKAGHPSLETIWELYPVTVPVGSLSLTLNLDSDSPSMSESKALVHKSSWPLLESGGVNQPFSCYTDCSSNLEKEAKGIPPISVSTSSSLPLWLKRHKEEIKRNTSDDKECINVSDLCKKWNSLCGPPQKQPYYPEKRMKFASSPPSPTSVSSHDNNSIDGASLSWPVVFEPLQLSKEGCVPKPELLSNPNSSPNSASSSEAMDELEGLQSFKELNAKNSKILCRELVEKVPWQKDIIPDIVTTILQCRSGMSKSNQRPGKEESWLFFLGGDDEGKEKVARELARLVFGSSQANFISLGLSSFTSPTRDDDHSTKEFPRNKRARGDLDCNYLERFGLALNENPHRVFFMEDVEQLDHCTSRAIRRCIESGVVALSGGENVPLKDAIVIFTCDNYFTSTPTNATINHETDQDHHKDNNGGGGNLEPKGHNNNKVSVVSLDLNIAIESIDDSVDGDNSSGDQVGLLEVVDRQFAFRVQGLIMG